MVSVPCTHCGTPVELPTPVTPVYCCPGCELAAAIICDAGLARYYQEREALPPRPGAPATGWDRVPVVSAADGTCQAELFLEGLHCASCVWVSEKVMASTAGVHEATVSYATGRTSLRWDPQQTSLEAICKRVSSLGYRPRAAASGSSVDRDLLLRLGVAGFAAMNAMMFSVPLYLGWWEGIADRYAALFRWSLLVVATPVALWAAVPFYRGAIAGLRTRVPHVDLPVSLGILALFAHGVWATFVGEEAYFDSLTMLVALLLGGRVLDQGRRRRALAAATSLAAEAPRVARRLGVDGRIDEVGPESLQLGDRVISAAGEEIAADGTVVEGRGAVRLALLTGESEPVVVGPGDRVVAGGVLVDGAITVSVEAVAAESLIARMAEGVRTAADRPIEPTPADRIAPVFTVLTVVIAALTLGLQTLFHGLDAAWPATVAVLVVACPCALALASPLSSAAGLGAAARRGLLLRSGDSLRRLAAVDLVVMDKTGTLTTGLPEVVYADDAVLRLAAAVERHSNHPVARAILEACRARDLPVPLGTLIREEPGAGITGEADGQIVNLRSSGPGRVGLYAVDGSCIGEIELRDRVRPDAARAIQSLRALGLDVALLSGDHADVAARIADEVGISTVVAGAGPEVKADWIRARIQEGRRVLFVGDGLNDGPALAAATVGLAMGSGSASSVLVADGVVSTAALGPVVAGLYAARAATSAVRASLRGSLVYNALAVAAAAFGYVNPLVAAVLMPLSSGIVVARAAAVERSLRGLNGRNPAAAPAGPDAGRAVPGLVPARYLPGAV